jgi:NADH dehydrogenase
MFNLAPVRARARRPRSAGLAPHIVVVGGGFGGLQAALHLAHLPVRVTLVDRRNFHLFQPLAYQVATGALAPAEIDAWEGTAPNLKTLEGALTLRRRILEAFEAAELETDPARRAAWLTFTVVGGGPTGVEMAGQIAEIARDLQRDFRSVPPDHASIILVEAGDRVLKEFAPSLSRKAGRALGRLGVTVRLGQSVVDVRTDSVVLGRGAEGPETIGTRTVVWAAGVVASPLAGALAERAGVDVDRAGRIEVLPDFSLPGHPEVQAIGDMVSIRQSDGSAAALPGLAPVAMQEGRYAARPSAIASAARTSAHFTTATRATWRPSAGREQLPRLGRRGGADSPPG